MTALFFYGYDLAEKKDYFAVVINAVIPDFKVPRLITLRKMRGVPYPEVIRILKKELWPRYPPYKHVTDYSNEKTFTEILEETYGKERVDGINFTMANKLMLKQDGLKALQLGYEWPRSQNPQIQALIDETKSQLQHEQMIETKAGNTTFDHPSGQHNDLAIAWELSIHGALRYLMRDATPGIVHSANADGSEDFWTQYKTKSQEVYDNGFKAKAEMIKRAPGLTITDVQVNGDSVDTEDPFAY